MPTENTSVNKPSKAFRKIELVKYALTFLLSNLEEDVIEDIQDYVVLTPFELEDTLQSMIDELKPI